jgi:phosphoglycerate dehydrogenase-like enzyme
MPVNVLVSEKYAAAHGAALCARIRSLCRVELRLVVLPTQIDPTMKSMQCWDTEGRNVIARDELLHLDACYVSEDVQFSWPTMLSMFASILDARNMRWMQISWVGIDFPLFSQALFAKPGLVITNAAGTNAGAVATSALAALISLHRGLHHWVAAKARGEGWLDREKLPPRRDLVGRTVLVFGWGAIGSEVGRLCAALGMDVVGMRRRVDAATAAAVAAAAAAAAGGGVALVAATASNLDRELPRTDYVVLACPLTEQTRGMFDAGMLRRMRPTACLLNVGRGAVVDEDALAAALAEGRLGGAYLDAFSTEPLPSDHALWSAPNLIISPHDAATCADNAARVEGIFVRNLEALCSRLCVGEADPTAGLSNRVWPTPAAGVSPAPAPRVPVGSCATMLATVAALMLAARAFR